MQVRSIKYLKLTNGVFWQEGEEYTVSSFEARALLSALPDYFEPADKEAKEIAQRMEDGDLPPMTIASVYHARGIVEDDETGVEEDGSEIAVLDGEIAVAEGEQHAG